jgi:hypothetical protein
MSLKVLVVKVIASISMLLGVLVHLLRTRSILLVSLVAKASHVVHWR